VGKVDSQCGKQLAVLLVDGSKRTLKNNIKAAEATAALLG
jgi:hypothetical protein